MDELQFIRLGVDDPRDEEFDCGNNDLNEFFFEDSKGNSRELLAVTYAWNLNGKTIAFFSVSNDAIKSQDVENYNQFKKFLPHRKRYKSIPAVKIGRFAVHKDFRQSGYGTKILDFIKIWFVTNNKTGCRFIVVDALAEALPFYEKNINNDDKNKPIRLMYFDLKFVSPVNYK